MEKLTIEVRETRQVEIPDTFPQYRKVLTSGKTHFIYKINSLEKNINGMFGHDAVSITPIYGFKCLEEACFENAYGHRTVEATEEEWNEALNKHIEYCHSLKNPIN